MQAVDLFISILNSNFILHTLNIMAKEIYCKWKGCFKLFVTDMDCFEHVKSTHIKNGIVTCSWAGCNIKTSTKWNLVNHINCHLDVKRGMCYICNKSFKWLGDYRRHAYKHSVQNSEFSDAVNLLFARQKSSEFAKK